MAKIFVQMRLIAGALALAFVVATAMPAAAQQPSSVNPTAAAFGLTELGCCAATGIAVATTNASVSAPAIKRICAKTFAMPFLPKFKSSTAAKPAVRDVVPASPRWNQVAIDSR
jgi:hypothetical protein